ncbi:MAG: GumC family protein, partial [Pseudomonadota bacterium]
MRKEPILAAELLPKSNELDLLTLFSTLWRGKWFILACLLLCMALGGYYAFALATLKYTSTTTIALENRNSQVVDFESVVSGLSADQASVNTEVEVLRARILVGKVVDQLQLVEDPEFNPRLRPTGIWPPTGMLREIGLLPPAADLTPKALRDKVVDELLQVVAVRNLRDSFVFRIAVTTEDAEKSARIADTLAELYINDQLVTKFQATEQATAWLTDRVSELQIELEVAETQVKDYNSSIDLIGPEALAALNRQLKDIRARLTNSERDLEAHRTRIAAMEAARDSGDVLAMGAAAGDETLIAAAARASVDQDARAAFDARFGQLFARAQVARDREAAQAAALRASVTDIEAKVEAQSADLVKLQQLEREAAASGLIYEYFLSRLKETSVQQGIQQADSRILSYAVVADVPSEPRKDVILLLAGMVGMAVGAGFVLLREMRHTGFRSAEDLSRITGLTVIGQIPRGPNTKRRKVLDYIVSKP